MQLLIDKGADINVDAQASWPALEIAAYNGHLEVVKFLISNSSYLDADTNCGNRALRYAAKTGNLAVL